MAILTAGQAAAKAEAAVGKHCVPRTCLLWVRTLYNAPGGPPTAWAGWKLTKDRHTGDRNPPVGVPVWFSGNFTSPAGHVAESIGGGQVVSTDWPHTGLIGRTTIDQIETEWKHRYLGWSGDIDGVSIPGIGGAAAAPPGSVQPLTPGDAFGGAAGQTAQDLINSIPGGSDLLALASGLSTVSDWSVGADAQAHWRRVGLGVLGAATAGAGIIIFREGIRL